MQVQASLGYEEFLASQGYILRLYFKQNNKMPLNDVQ